MLRALSLAAFARRGAASAPLLLQATCPLRTISLDSSPVTSLLPWSPFLAAWLSSSAKGRAPRAKTIPPKWGKPASSSALPHRPGTSRTSTPALAPPPLSNGAITAPTLRVVFPDATHRIMGRAEALQEAQALKLDLVLLAGSAQPPVARLTSLAKLREDQRRAAEGAASSSAGAAARPESKGDAPKELHFSPVIGDHDAMVKVQQARSWLAKQQRAALHVEFKRDEAPEAAIARAQAWVDSLREVGVPEQPIRQFKATRVVRVILKPRPPAAAAPAVAVGAPSSAAPGAASTLAVPVAAPAVAHAAGQ